MHFTTYFVSSPRYVLAYVGKICAYVVLNNSDLDKSNVIWRMLFRMAYVGMSQRSHFRTRKLSLLLVFFSPLYLERLPLLYYARQQFLYVGHTIPFFAVVSVLVAIQEVL